MFWINIQEHFKFIILPELYLLHYVLVHYFITNSDIKPGFSLLYGLYNEYKEK